MIINGRSLCIFIFIALIQVAPKLARPIADGSKKGILENPATGSKQSTDDELVLVMDPDKGPVGEMISITPSSFALSEETFDQDYGDDEDDDNLMRVYRKSGDN